MILDEDTPAFAALAAAVRAQLSGSVPLLRGGTEFTPNPVCFAGCPSGCH